MWPHRKEALMALVICDISSSLDGYVTGPNDSRENPFGDGAGMLHDWMFDAATDEDPGHPAGDARWRRRHRDGSQGI